MKLLVKYLKLLGCCFICFCCNLSLRAQTVDFTYAATYYHSIHYKGIAWVSSGEQARSCQFNLVNVIDSFLYVQVNVAGIEAGRVLAKPDSILLINKLQKQFYEGDYSFFNHLLDIDFNFDFFSIQNFFNGIPVYLPEEVTLAYEGEQFMDNFSLFKSLICNYEEYELELNIKKVTFNEVPEVSIQIPKNFTPIMNNDW
ncbi:MAG: DUF4292 domain-containing protein [Lentimicrobiaceae bacterium]|nr:DUF4292 domain-containing protein [Lentimicrobiaceae bacterium]